MIVVAIALCVAQPASAQLGGLVNKAKKAVKEKVTKTVEKSVDDAKKKAVETGKSAVNVPDGVANAAGIASPEDEEAAFFNALQAANDKAYGQEPLGDEVEVWFISDKQENIWGTWNRKENKFFRKNSDGSSITLTLGDDNNIYNGSGKVIGSAANNTLTYVRSDQKITFDLEKRWIYDNGKPIGVLSAGTVKDKPALEFHSYRQRTPFVFKGWIERYMKEDLRLPLWVVYCYYFDTNRQAKALEGSLAFQRELENKQISQSRKLKPWMQNELVQFIKKNGYHKLNGKEGKILWMEMGDNGWKMFRKDDIWKTLATRGLMVDVLVKFDDCYEESRFYLEQDFKGGNEGDDSSYGPLYISRKWKKLPDPLYR